MRQKLDSGAILVHGKEELPLGYDSKDDNIRSQQQPYSDNDCGRITFGNEEDQRCCSKREGETNQDLRGYGRDREDASRRNKNKTVDEFNGTKDKNANARLLRSHSCHHRQSATLPRRRRRRAFSGSFADNPLPPHRVTTDGTAIYYWCELPRRPGSQGKFFPHTPFISILIKLTPAYLVDYST